MMNQKLVIMAFAAALSGMLASPGCGLGGADLAPVEKNKAIIAAVATSIVHVEYTLQTDNAESPRGGAWGSYEQYVREERPREVAGLLLADDMVLAPDMMIHPRFVKSIAVRFGDVVVSAEPAACALDRNAVMLKLAGPLKGAKPIVFDATREGPYFSVGHDLREDEWITNVRGAPAGVTVTERGGEYHPAVGCWLIVDGEGGAVGVCSAGRLDTAGKWKGSPLKWPARTAKQMAALVAETEQRAKRALLRVALSFRSPKKSEETMGGSSSSASDGKAERNVVGMLIDDTRIVVLADLQPKVTARLERIAVHTPEGGAVEAKFSHTLKDYGCFLAKLAKPVKGGLKLSTKPITPLRGQMLMSAEVTIQGENSLTYFDHRRIRGYSLGWKRHVYPQIGAKSDNLFLFDADGQLVVFPLAKRAKITTTSRYSSDDVLATPAARLVTVLGDLASNVDKSNVPLVAEEESRLAWLGVELQRLNRDLARLNNLSRVTKDGQIGALVSYVYPGSPAAKAGVTADPDADPWFLINIHVEDDPEPFDVTGERSRGAFPWSQWDRLPPGYWDGRFPTPWPRAETRLNRKLTNAGFGKKFVATFNVKGNPVKKSFSVVPSPTHYDSAPSYKSGPVGLTVRDMTFEARRYFQKTVTDPGVIVHAVVPGSRAGVGGIRPYEIITHVNDKPVTGVKGFAGLIAGQDELRLTVLRMTTGRLVKLRMTGP